MNKAITDGITFMPPAFGNGLNVWARGDGVPGSDTYAGDPNAGLVAADQDFGGCLELLKTQATQKLRHMGQTPILPGCYLQVRARVKAVSGNLPDVRIAAWAGGAGGQPVPGVVTTGPARTLSTYGEVVEVTAILGTGARSGVDMAWGRNALYAHVGLDLTGPNGGVVRIDDIEVEDVTAVFLRDMISQVDVRDYGALGNGTTDDSAAFEAADTAAQGRRVFVPAGTYRLASNVTIDNPVLFEGTVTMPADRILILNKSFDLPSYISAFGDEETAFRKAFQALLNNADHESLDMGGRSVSLSAPVDMQAAVPNRTSFSTRRVIRNGQFEAEGSAPWATQVVTSQASYTPSNPRMLTNVVNVANIPVGALVQGAGVGREVYVRSRNVGQQTVTLNAPLFDAAGTQTFTFRRFRYLLDFSGFSSLSKFSLENIEFQCRGEASGVMLAPAGLIFHLKDCFISRPRDRGLTSIGEGCQGMLIDRCQFLSNEDDATVAQRVSIALNAAANDVKLRDNRATRFRHFAVLGGSNTLILGNHFFQGDELPQGVRTGGIVLTSNYNSTIIDGNYVDNTFIEWTNEWEQAPAFTGGFSFAAVTITNNIFLCSNVAPWFSFIVVRPHGAGHFLNGVSISGNRFRATNGAIDRVERVDTSFANLDFSRFKDVDFTGNSYHNVTEQVSNPLWVDHTQGSHATVWTIGTDDRLPFGGRSRRVDSVTVTGNLRNASNVISYASPNAFGQIGPGNDQVELRWAQAYRGDVRVSVRID